LACVCESHRGFAQRAHAAAARGVLQTAHGLAPGDEFAQFVVKAQDFRYRAPPAVAGAAALAATARRAQACAPRPGRVHARDGEQFRIRRLLD
jgi:hypothetical protein